MDSKIPTENNNRVSKVSKSSKIKEILYEGYFYDVTDWMKRHPGGRIIEFYTKSGEDSTLAVQQFHHRSMLRVSGIMKSLKKRPASSAEEIGISSKTLIRHQNLTQDFQALQKALEVEGFFLPSIPHVIYRLAELGFLIGAAIILNSYGTSLNHFGLQVLSILCMACFGGRCGWLMHEAGHHSMTGSPQIDRFLQSLIFGLGTGMSASWWSSQHNRHHAMPQRLKHDVDLETLPLLAFNKRILKDSADSWTSKGSTKTNFFLQNQSILFILLDCFLVASFWKLYLHPRYVFKKGSYFDLLFISLHYYFTFNSGFGLLPYLCIVWLTSVYIFVNFALSHTHLPVTDEPLHWVEYSFLHTMDIQPSGLCNWWMCYLNFQIEHHLFPTMPQFRHPLVAKRVKALADKHKIPYQCIGYWDALKKTMNNLKQVSKELREMH